MANERYGNKYLVLLGHESGGYGTQQIAPTATLYCSCVMKENTNQIETGTKTGDTEQWKNDVLAGTKSGTVTLSGELSLEDTNSEPVGYGALLAAFFSSVDADGGNFGTGSYTNPTAGSGESFTIYQYFTTLNSSGNATYDFATGCVPESLEITGSSGEAITFEMTFRAKDITRETEETTANTLTASTTYSDTTPLLFQHATLAKCLGGTNLTTMNSFTLTLNNSFADDNLIYQNAPIKSQEILCRFTGNLTVELNYSSANSSDIYDNIMTAALKECEIQLSGPSGTNYWKFVTNGKVTDFDRPDPDRCIFTNSYTKKLMGDKSGPTAAITVSHN